MTKRVHTNFSRRLLAIALTLVMILALLPALEMTARAEVAQQTETLFFETNGKLYIGADSTTTIEAVQNTNYTGTYNYTSNTLTFTDFSFTTAAATALDLTALPSGAKVVFEGANSFTSTYNNTSGVGTDDGSEGILLENAATFGGTGSVTATGGTLARNSNYGINTDASLTITDSLNVTATGGGATSVGDSYGIRTGGILYMRGAANVTAQGGTATTSRAFYNAPTVSMPIYNWEAGASSSGNTKNLVAYNAGTAFNYGDEKYAHIGVDGTLDFNASALAYGFVNASGELASGAVTVPASTNAADGLNYTYSATGVGGATPLLTLNGISFTTTAATALNLLGLPNNATVVFNGTNSFVSTQQSGASTHGIWFKASSTYNITFAGTGSVTAAGGTATTDGSSYGIRLNAHLTIQDNVEVSATGGTASVQNSIGLNASGSIAISGAATVTATGGTANAASSGIGGTSNISISGTAAVIAQSTDTNDGTAQALTAAPTVTMPYKWRTTSGGSYTLSSATAFTNAGSPKPKYVEIVGMGASVGDVTVSGTVGTALTSPYPTTTITLVGDTLKETITSRNVSTTWFTSVPSGINAFVSGAEGSTRITLSFSGTPAAVSTAAFGAITIPASALTSGAAITAPANANAVFAIAQGDGAAISGTVAASSKTDTSITVNSSVLSLATATGQSIEYAYGNDATGADVSYGTSAEITGLTPNTTYYIFARSQANTNYTAGTASVSAAIKTKKTSAATPEIDDQPIGATYYIGTSSVTALSVTASGDSLSYQWYSNDENNTTTSTTIAGATSNSYTPPVSSTGTVYYYCVVMNTDADAVSASTATSSIVAITVRAPYSPPPAPDPTPPIQTIPVEDGEVEVPFVEQEGAASLQLPAEKTEEILTAAVENGSENADFDFTSNTEVTKAEAPKEALETLVEAGLGLEFNFAGGSAQLDPETAADILAKAEGETLEIKVEELPEVSNKELNSEQIGTLAVGDTVYDVSIVSNGVEIHEFAGTVKVTVPYTGKLPVKAWFMGDRGKSEKIDGIYNPADGTFTFTVPHLSMWVVGQDETWPFTDVAEDDSVNWFYSDVKFVWENGLMQGTSDTLFSPYSPTTRAMAVTILYRLEGQPATDANHTDFSDVSESAYYHDAVAWAAENEIVLGVGENLFAPERNITREQLAAIFYRYAVYKGYDVTASADLSGYTDAEDISGYAITAMKWANAEGIITGRSAITFAPNGTATRAEIAAMLHRFVTNVANAGQ